MYIVVRVPETRVEMTIADAIRIVRRDAHARECEINIEAEFLPIFIPIDSAGSSFSDKITPAFCDTASAKDASATPPTVDFLLDRIKVEIERFGSRSRGVGSSALRFRKQN